MPTLQVLLPTYLLRCRDNMFQDQRNLRGLSNTLLRAQRMLEGRLDLLGVHSTSNASLLLYPSTIPTLESCIWLDMNDRTFHFEVLWEL